MDSKTPATQPVAEPPAANQGDAQDVARFVHTLMQQVQDRFQTMSDQILTRIDEMGTRIDDLEHNLNDLMANAGIPADPVTSQSGGGQDSSPSAK